MMNVLNTSKPVTGITHPLVADMYLKKDFDAKDRNILVIEARRHDIEDNDTEHDGFDSYLVDLLIDLEDLKAQAESKIGSFDRVDIRTN